MRVKMKAKTMTRATMRMKTMVTIMKMENVLTSTTECDSVVTTLQIWALAAGVI